MFERYTETARRTIFMGRYEASVLGSPSIETHHLLLGLLRADVALATRIFHSQRKVEEIRRPILQEVPPAATKISTSVDLPLTEECKRVLDHAAHESERFENKRITTGHLLLGIVHELKSIAARVVLESGITFEHLREESKQVDAETQAVAQPPREVVPSEAAPQGVRDLVTDARNGALTPFIGRERELEQLMRILSRRTKNSAVLVGEPGVGKHAIVCGLAQRIAQDDVPADFRDRPILMVDNWALAGPPRQALSQILEEGDPILYVRNLFDSRDGLAKIANHIANASRQVITTGAPLSLRLALERNEELARHFEPITVLPPSDEEATDIIIAATKQFEAFHDVVISPEAIQTAVSASSRFLRHRVLPDRALDLIDDACARVKLRRHRQPPAVAEREKHLRATVKKLENAIANHQFEEARKFSYEEREIREEILRLAQELQVPEQSNAVTPEDIVEAIAARTSLTVPAVIAALERPEAIDAREDLRRTLAAQIPVGRHDWIEGLIAYLADCSATDAGRLIEAMRAAKANFDKTT